MLLESNECTKTSLVLLQHRPGNRYLVVIGDYLRVYCTQYSILNMLSKDSLDSHVSWSVLTNMLKEQPEMEIVFICYGCEDAIRALHYSIELSYLKVKGILIYGIKQTCFRFPLYKWNTLKDILVNRSIPPVYLSGHEKYTQAIVHIREISTYTESESSHHEQPPTCFHQLCSMCTGFFRGGYHSVFDQTDHAISIPEDFIQKCFIEDSDMDGQ